MTIKNCSSFHSLRLCLNFTDHMTSSVNTFKEKHQHHSDGVSKNKQNSWTRTGWSLTLRAGQEVSNLCLAETTSLSWAEPRALTQQSRLTTSRRLVVAGQVNSSGTCIMISETKTENDVNSERTKQTDKNSPQWGEVGSCHEASKPTYNPCKSH